MTSPVLVARSAVMRTLLEQVRRFAAADGNVLIAGETGVGKDLIARTLHSCGPRRSQPFVAVDCPSLHSSLFESELFGHEAGAFTGATAARAGRFELAGNGTVYLDKIGELPLEMQGKLLRVVSEKRVERMGANLSVQVRARIVASADARIEDDVRDGFFRGDLYHRLRVLPLFIPPLRERRTDIEPLARACLRDACLQLDRAPVRLTRRAGEALRSHSWPGNVRQLRHVLERALLSSPAAVIDVEQLPLDLFDDTEACFGRDARDRPTLQEVERKYIELVLRQARGNQTEAARILGISRKALWQKRRRFGLD
jgi:DNA-binding NtrC family response regulator